MNSYDEVTAFLGNWGRFQKILFFILYATVIPNGLGVLSVVFIVDNPKHHCSIPDVNLTEDWLQAIIPIEVVNGVEEQSRCSRYRLDVVLDLWAKGFAPGDVNLTQLKQEPCVDGWTYSKDIYHSTLVTEFDLVCSDQWKQPFTSTIYFVGVLVGSFFCGQLSDRFGRKPVFFITLGIQTLFTFLQVFSTSWEMYSVLMFFSGLGQIANYVSAFVLGAEVFCGNVQTVYTTAGVCLGFSTGYMLLPLFAYFIRQWRFLVLAIALPGAVFIPLWWITPESPRWLLSQGRVEEAEAIIKKAADMNKVKAPTVIFENYKAEENTDKKSPRQYTVIDLYRNREMRVPSLILALIWFNMGLGYYGLSLNTSKLSADPFLACFISAAVEVPAYITTWFVVKFFPRRPIITTFMLLGGAALLTIQAVPQSLPALSITLEMFGKFCFTINAALAFPCTAEIYPTFMRNTATGTCSSFSRIGTSIAPFIFQLSVYFQFLPYIFLGSMSLALAIGALFLPETFGHPLPDTIDDMKTFQRWRCSCTSQKNRSNCVDVLETKL
ncbi:organic cation/carnitine transporter 2-like [Periophthalmus magnuspinnatus]|uniref:organic cation/carnitine transporter 2-like n=1 Tax=Periophthalmus magnuspinnatus TaxID=409849 RepID=UPI0024371D9E|nr:organic cation/carnitine transporter 2-like [Periophthalmus magnuspinnatus]